MTRLSAWATLAGTVVIGAVLQGLTAAPGYVSTTSAAFVWATVASIAVLYAQVLLVAASVTSLRGTAPAWRRLVLWSAGVVLVAVLIGVLVPFLLPLVAVAALCVLPSAALGRRARAGFAVFRDAPIGASAATLVTLVACVLVWITAGASGLFLTGTIGGIVTWLMAGVTGAALLVWWSHLQGRVRLIRETHR